MIMTKHKRAVYKEADFKQLNEKRTSSFQKYHDFFVGRPGLASFVKYEIICSFLGPMPGGLGLLFRKWFFPRLFRRVGSGVLWGRNITLRHPFKIEIGNRVAIDDNCLLDARGAGSEGIQIGNDVLIARDCIIQAKCAPVTIGDRCTIGSQCQLSSAGGISLGKSVGLAGQCYIGGGRYEYDDKDVPILDQLLYSKGKVIIEDDAWVGAGAIVQDGVRIGKGSVVGAGAIVREDLPEYTVVTPHQKFIMLPRGHS